MFFIARGECDVYVLDNAERDKFVKTLHAGNYFGEVAILKECKRTATVNSKFYSTMAQYDAAFLKDLIQSNPSIQLRMEKHMVRNYNDKLKSFLRESLRNIDYF